VIYLLDTNVCICFLNGSSPLLVERFKTHRPTDIVLSSVVKAELSFGARRSRRVAENLLLLKRFFEPFATLPFDDRSAEEYGIIRRDLERSGVPIGPNDLLIAATARAHDLTLVTHSLREFSCIAGLRVEDWEA